jgi:hypothetical protein
MSSNYDGTSSFYNDYTQLPEWATQVQRPRKKQAEKPQPKPEEKK